MASTLAVQRHEACQTDRCIALYRRVQLLAAGDAAAILMFAAIGRINHGEMLDIELLLTALPFWTGAGAAFMKGALASLVESELPSTYYSRLSCSTCMGVGPVLLPHVYAD
jgi:Protein of unknown function (DUF3054)